MERVDAVCMLKRTTTTEFKPEVFLRGLLSNKQGWEEQISVTSLLSTLQSKSPKRFASKKGLLKDNLLRSRSMNNSLTNNPQKAALFL